VPAGKRLVIEYVTAEAYVAPGVDAGASFVAGPFASLRHALVLSFQGNSLAVIGPNSFSGSERVLIFVSEGDQPRIRPSRSGGVGQPWEGSASVSGYLVDP
jgi:hypothetical protein